MIEFNVKETRRFPIIELGLIGFRFYIVVDKGAWEIGFRIPQLIKSRGSDE